MSLTKVRGRERFDQPSNEMDPLHGKLGEYIVKSWEEAMADAGRLFIVNAGTGTTPIAFGAGTIDTTEPDLDFELPVNAAVKVKPRWVLVHMEAYGTDAIFEGMVSIGLGGVFGTTGGTAITPVNARLDKPYGTVCRAIGNVDGSGATYMTSNVLEINRWGFEKVATIGTGDDDSTRGPCTFIWSAKQSGICPVMVATAGSVARLNVFSGSQAGTGFIQLGYTEEPL